MNQKTKEVAFIAALLMKQHGLADWKLKIGRGKRFAGFCEDGRKTITISRYLIEHNPLSEVIETILHEIAHALVGCHEGHNEVWKSKAAQIGARPTRCFLIGKDKMMPEPTYKATCQDCFQIWTWHRKPRGWGRDWACSKCKEADMPNKGKLIWSKV